MSLALTLTAKVVRFGERRLHLCLSVYVEQAVADAESGAGSLSE